MGSFSSPVGCRVDRCRSGMGEPRKSAMSAVMDFLRLDPGSQVQSGASAAGLIGGWFRSLGVSCWVRPRNRPMATLVTSANSSDCDLSFRWRVGTNRSESRCYHDPVGHTRIPPTPPSQGHSMRKADG